MHTSARARARSARPRLKAPFVLSYFRSHRGTLEALGCSALDPMIVGPLPHIENLSPNREVTLMQVDFASSAVGIRGLLGQIVASHRP